VLKHELLKQHSARNSSQMKCLSKQRCSCYLPHLNLTCIDGLK
jgi:hypothetical protein